MTRHAFITTTSLLVAAFSPATYAVQGVSLATGLTDFTTWSLFGSATAANQTPGNGFTYSQLELTARDIGGQGGSGFAPTALVLDFNQDFFFDFHFYIPVSAGLRGDGLTFTLASAAGLGNAGSGLGYEGINNSVAFAIDTFHFGPDPGIPGDPGEPVSPSLQILTGGSVSPVAVTLTGLGDTIRDPDFQWYASVSYTASGLNNTGTLTGHIEHLNLGIFEVSAVVDFDTQGMVGNPVFYGFTASNGLATDAHIVTSAIPVPEPESAALLLAGLGLMGWLLRRRVGAAPLH